MGSGSKRLIIVAIVVLSVVPALIGVGVAVVGALERLAEPPEGGGGTLGAPSREQSSNPSDGDPLPSSRPRRAIAPPPRTFSPLTRSTSEVVATFPAALAALRRRLGPTTQLTSVTVNEVSVLFAYRRGRSSRAGVLRWRPERRALEPANSAFSGVGSASDAAYPMAAVRAGVPRRLIAAVKRLAPRGHVVQTMLLFRLPVSRAVTWQVNVQAGARYLTYRAPPKGRPLRELR